MGAPLVRFAVATAGEHGGTRMIALIQKPNVAFFRRLGWSRLGARTSYRGATHQEMTIPLAGAQPEFAPAGYTWALGGLRGRSPVSGSAVEVPDELLVAAGPQAQAAAVVQGPDPRAGEPGAPARAARASGSPTSRKAYEGKREDPLLQRDARRDGQGVDVERAAEAAGALAELQQRARHAGHRDVAGGPGLARLGGLGRQLEVGARARARRGPRRWLKKSALRPREHLALEAGEQAHGVARRGRCGPRRGARARPTANVDRDGAAAASTVAWPPTTGTP